MTLGQRVARTVEAAFNELAPGAKPPTRSNGTAEWTVLAGLVAVDSAADSVRLVSLATGVKAMPDAARAYSHGAVVHDMHAEILCLRMFNWCVMEALAEPWLLEKSAAHGLRLKASLKLALYISEPPCGDASMALFHDDAWGDRDDGRAPKRHKPVLRGRAHFDRLGQVRTKPGRADSRVSYSKSCSDKLCVKQYTGILNCVSSLCVEPVFLDYLVLPQDKYNAEAFARCFHTRPSQPPPRPLEVLTFQHSEYPFAKRAGAVPSPLSLVHCAATGYTQMLAGGVKNGAFRKNKPPRPAGESILCKRRLWAQARGTIGAFDTYLAVKAANEKRQQLKRDARGYLGAWPPTTPEDFSLDL